MEVTVKKTEDITLELKLTRKELDAIKRGIGKTSVVGLKSIGVDDESVTALHLLWSVLQGT